MTYHKLPIFIGGFIANFIMILISCFFGSIIGNFTNLDNLKFGKIIIFAAFSILSFREYYKKS
jgi:putative Ca2+/H+ antiporter (TMEM165/GDT1 family)